MAMQVQLTLDEITEALGLCAVKKAKVAGGTEVYTNVHWNIQTCAGEVALMTVTVDIDPLCDGEQHPS